jgi:hypothetical protein
VFDGNTPGEAYQWVLRGIDEGDPAVLDAIEPPAIRPGAGYDQDDLARDFGMEPCDRALPRAVSAYADAFTDAFWRDPAKRRRQAKENPHGKEYGNTAMPREDKLARYPGKFPLKSSCEAADLPELRIVPGEGKVGRSPGVR